MPTLRNVNPLGEVDVPLLGRSLAAGEEFDVPQDIADQLIEQSNYELVEADLSALKVDELKQYAVDHDIDLGDAKTKAEILAAIQAAQAAGTNEQAAQTDTNTTSAAADAEANPTEG